MEPTEYAQKMSETVMNGFVALEISIGHKLGLFEALKKSTHPVTSQDLADACNLKERYVREWLGCMSSARFVNISDDGKYFIPEACKPFLKEPCFLASELPNIADNMPAVLKCFQKDGPKGYDYKNQMSSLMWLHEEKNECEGKWIDENAFPNKWLNKDRVYNILDIGCATGSLTINIAKHFPKASVYGADIHQEAISKARSDKKERKVGNIEFYHSNGGALEKSWDKKFDWILLVDTLHDLPNPTECLTEIKRVLKDDGVVTAIDPPVHSDHKLNVGAVRAPLLYVFSTFVCLPCSMSAEPSVGHGIGWGTENRNSFLISNGFKLLEGEDLGILQFRKDLSNTL